LGIQAQIQVIAVYAVDSSPTDIYYQLTLKKVTHYKTISLLAANELEWFPSNRPPPCTVKMWGFTV